MLSRSKSSKIFSPRLRVVGQFFDLQIKGDVATQANESKPDPPSQDRYTYVCTSDGIDIHQPEQKTNDLQVLTGSPNDASSSSGFGAISLRSEISLRDLPSPRGVEKADDASEILSPIAEPLYRRRGRNIVNLKEELRAVSESFAVASDIGYVSSESPLIYPPIDQKYTLVKDVGSGGEGECSLVKQKKDGQLRVIKTVKNVQKIAGKPIEVTMLNDVFPDRHDNIIRLHNYETFWFGVGARYYFEYCDGGDLYDLVSRYHQRDVFIPELFIWKAFAQLASALEFLHRGYDRHCEDPNRPGMCHRDIKPENVFLRLPDSGKGYPDLVLADFGCATFEFATYDRKGTFAWQGNELPRQSPKGDVYSLGAIIHYMIHLELHLGPLPIGLRDTRHNREMWDVTPEARQPKTTIPEPYTKPLCEFMLIAMNPDHSTRITSARLSQELRRFADRVLPKFDGPDDESHEWPLADWACGNESDGCRRAIDQGRLRTPSDLGNQQYFLMMDEWEAENEAEVSLLDEMRASLEMD